MDVPAQDDVATAVPPKPTPPATTAAARALAAAAAAAEKAAAEVEHLADLQRHTGAVNAVRFAPDGMSSRGAIGAANVRG